MNVHGKQHYIVHQHHLSDNAHIALVAEGWDSKNPEVRAYAAKSSGSKKWKPMDWRFYRPVMKVAAANLEGVFEAGNGYGKFRHEAQRIDKRAHSVSVGDIVQLGGLYWMVEPCGWKDISDRVRMVRNAIHHFDLLAAEQSL